MAHFDSRCFTSPHTHANFDFDGIRGFDTSFHLRIPGPFKYTGRDVVHNFKRFEMWSPNSRKTPVYPGTKPVGFSLVPPLPHPRSDGSGGRFDWTLIPQHIDINTLYHAFILDPARLKVQSPEFVYLTSVWESLSPAKGRLKKRFVESLLARGAKLEHRRLEVLKGIPPMLQALGSLVSHAPRPSDIQRFGEGTTWDSCVEGMVHIQRVMREKDGWLRMMDALHSTGWNIDVPLVSPLPAAREHCLGAWINGVDERVARWLLHVGVPCFIIHEYRVGLDFGPDIPDRRSRHATHSFCPKDVWHLLPDINAYEVVALRHATSWSETLPSLSCSNVIASADALDLSSSHSQGYVRPESDVYQKPEPEDGDITWPLVCLYKDRDPWLKPPPIMVPDKKGAWSRFCITSMDVKGHPLHGRDIMQERGKAFKGTGLVGPYYDRQNRRQLYFTSSPLRDMPAGLVSDPSFGFPVPFYNFFSLDVPNRPPKTTRPSTWMYAKADPKPADIGKEAPVPAATQLRVYPRVPTDPYQEEDYDDDDDEDYPRYRVQPPGPPPPSPPASDNMERLPSVPGFDLDILSVIIAYQRHLHASPSPQAPTSPSLG